MAVVLLAILDPTTMHLLLDKTSRQDHEIYHVKYELYVCISSANSRVIQYAGEVGPEKERFGFLALRRDKN